MLKYKVYKTTTNNPNLYPNEALKANRANIDKENALVTLPSTPFHFYFILCNFIFFFFPFSSSSPFLPFFLLHPSIDHCPPCLPGNSTSLAEAEQ